MKTRNIKNESNSTDLATAMTHAEQNRMKGKNSLN